jgi:heme/copper-type cytochrome/quinol oxidase subunit 2
MSSDYATHTWVFIIFLIVLFLVLISVVTVVKAVPDAPILSGTAGNAEFVLSWTVPDSHNSPITGYIVSRLYNEPRKTSQRM